MIYYLNFIIIIFLKVQSIYGKLYNGKCPKVSNNITLDCRSFGFGHDLKIIGFVETASETINFFHNEFNSISCMDLRTSCIKNEDFLLSFQFSCKSFEKFKYCYPILMHRTQKLGGYSLKFDFTKETQCDESLIKSEIQILHNENYQYMIIYGCYEVDDDLTDQGVWVIAREIVREEKKIGYFKTHAKQVLEEINPKLYEDLTFYTEDQKECNCKSCDYFMRCKISSRRNKLLKSRGSVMKWSMFCVLVMFLVLSLQIL